MNGAYNMQKSRIDRLRGAVRESGCDAVIISDPMSIFYLTGASIHPFERMWLLIVRADGRDTLLANRLFVFEDTGIDTHWHTDNDDAPALLCRELERLSVIGVERDLPARYLIPMIDSIQGVKLSVTAAVDGLRIIKDEEELERMRVSSRINDEVLEEAFSQVREGMTEKELAAIVAEGFEKKGTEGQSFGAIVAFGENAADPHHVNDDTRLKKGDCVLIDMGCIWKSYCSDMTRTKFFGEVTEEQRKVYEIVREANQKAKEYVRPGVRFCDIDAAARDHISAAGYGEYFTHRLGHGIGLTEHEPKDVGPANTDTVEPGMVFSIEPGIYLPGKFGVRIEDLVIVTEDGCECLNSDSRELQII